MLSVFQCKHQFVRILLIVNAAASSVTARGQVVIRKALSADHKVAMAETSRRGHASRLARGAAADGTELVVVLGGDGTLNEAANGLVGTDCALATLPGGSTNVFARTLGYPNDPVEAVGVLLEALDEDAIESVGLGSVNDRYFLFHAGLGYDAAVVNQVERRSGLKRWAGHPLFAWSAVTTWMRHYDHSTPAFSVQFADGTVVDDGYFTIVSNTDPYTFLGNRPFSVAPDAGLDKPLAVTTMRSLKLHTVLSVVSSSLGTGKRARSHRKVSYRHHVEALRVVGHRPFPYQLDGDYLGEAEELIIEHRPNALRLVLPA
jgi:diacylglycerol kinase family enzyme